jgi:hypothetical protein
VSARSSKPEHLVLVANGENKADAVQKMIEGPVTSMITASALQLHPHAKVFIDDAAASKLTMRDYYDWIQAKKPGAPKILSRQSLRRRGAAVRQPAPV